METANIVGVRMCTRIEFTKNCKLDEQIQIRFEMKEKKNIEFPIGHWLAQLSKFLRMLVTFQVYCLVNYFINIQMLILLPVETKKVDNTYFFYFRNHMSGRARTQRVPK